MASKDPHDIQVNLRFSDGSVAVISYVTNGNPRYPKEILDVSASGRTARLDNFRRSTVWSGRRKRVRTRLRGHRQGPSRSARSLPRLRTFWCGQCPSRSNRSPRRRERRSPWRRARRAAGRSRFEPPANRVVLAAPAPDVRRRDGMARARRRVAGGVGAPSGAAGRARPMDRNATAGLRSPSQLSRRHPGQDSRSLRTRRSRTRPRRS